MPLSSRKLRTRRGGARHGALRLAAGEQGFDDARPVRCLLKGKVQDDNVPASFQPQPHQPINASFFEQDWLMKTQLKLAALVAGLAGAGLAQAALVNTPQAGIPFETLAVAPGGKLLASREGAVFAPTFTGVLRSAVVDGPEEGINLDFYYQFTNTSSSRDAVARLTASDFAGFVTEAFQTGTNVDALFPSGTVPADTVDRNATGSVIGFNFLPGGTNTLDAGQTSYTMIVRTNAQVYTDGTSGIIDGSGTTGLTFAPAIPEPETYALMLAGLGLLGLAKRRKGGKKAQAAPDANGTGMATA